MKSPLLFLGALALLSTFSCADDIVRIGLDGSRNAPAPEQEDGKDGIARIKKIDQAGLELFPTAKKPAKGTIMISPGGGYNVLAVTHEGRNVAKMLNDAGWDAAVLLYQVASGPTTREQALAQATQAFSLLQKRGTEFGLATNRVGILGFSAGGHLTARLAHETASTNPPAFVVLMYPAYLDKDGKLLEDVKPGKAPTFLYVAGNDKLFTGSEAYAAACQELGIPHELHKPESGGHGFGLKSEIPEAVREWPATLTAWLDKTIAKPK